MPVDPAEAPPGYRAVLDTACSHQAAASCPGCAFSDPADDSACNCPESASCIGVDRKDKCSVIFRPVSPVDVNAYITELLTCIDSIDEAANGPPYLFDDHPSNDDAVGKLLGLISHAKILANTIRGR